ncbi:AMP-binding protein [Pseudoalteromonas rubra]|uniref:AMP-binding protein n=1 Tax=Pseudoalteromonas rubra TaxID=43658 RepID=UPI000F78471C|nr:AMP-binding protein [Pseudoalteromonas rubra]
MEDIMEYERNNFLFDVPLTGKFTSYCELLDHLAVTMPHRLAIQFLKKGVEEEQLTYEELRERSVCIANRLLASGQAGDRVILMFDQGVDYITAFLGCLYARMVAVTAFPPQDPRRNDRLTAIMDDCVAHLILVNDKTWGALNSDAVSARDNVELINVSEVCLEYLNYQTLPQVQLDDLAFLQYTSGSTGTPKGVMITHRNLLSNVELERSNMGLHSKSVFVSWLPLYHDMGLILISLCAISNASPLYFMAPDDFVRNPLLWLEAISKYKGTVSGAPDFAFRMCCDRIKTLPEHVDLSSLEVLVNGSEPIRQTTVERFYNTFAPAGLSKNAMHSVYGLAESTVYVSGVNILKHNKRFCELSLENGLAVERHDGARHLASCGRVDVEFAPDIRIVNPHTQVEAEQNTVGEVWISAASNGVGYWGRAALSDEVFKNRIDSQNSDYLRTGDLGFIYQNHLYVCGRIKDLIIIRGRNLYPSDICSSVEFSHESLRSRPISAFSVDTPQGEKLVVAIANKGSADDFDKIVQAIKKRVLNDHGVDVSGVVFVSNQNLYRTTSGKIQHVRLRDEFIHNALSYRYRYLDEVLTALFEHNQPAHEVTESFEFRHHDVSQTLCTWVKDLSNSSERPDSQCNLFELGLDSLRVAQLLESIEEHYGVTVELNEFYEPPTLAELTDTVNQRFREKLGISVEQEHKLVEILV